MWWKKRDKINVVATHAKSKLVKNTMYVYTLTLSRAGSNETSKSLMLGYKGIFYTEESYMTTQHCTLSASISGTGTGQTQVNVTWMVTSPSRADIKWSDISVGSAKVLDDSAVITPAATTWSTGTYLTGGDTITVTLNRASVASGSIIKLVLVYTPSGGTFGESSITLTYVT